MTMQKSCPYCAETIKAQAIKCRYCHSDLRIGPDSVTSQASGPAVAMASAAPTPVLDQAALQYQATRKSTGVAYLLWLLFGVFGAHRYYLDRASTGVAMSIGAVVFSVMSGIGPPLGPLMFLGLAGFACIWIWCICDVFRIPEWVRQANLALAFDSARPASTVAKQDAPLVPAAYGYAKAAGPISISICAKCRFQGNGDDTECGRCGHVFA